jgi:hypothetical protein
LRIEDFFAKEFFIKIRNPELIAKLSAKRVWDNRSAPEGRLGVLQQSCRLEFISLYWAPEAPREKLYWAPEAPMEQ